MDRPVARVARGVSAAAVVSAVALRARALSPGGALAATVVGGAILGAVGLPGATALMTFFMSSTLLGRLPTALVIEQQRGNERDAVQVLANGGAAAILALASSMGPERVRSLLMTGFGGAIATATADTWATEIGSRSRQRPRSIATLIPVAPGESGGVTVSGLAASAAGASLIAGVTASGLRREPGPGLFIAVAGAGFAGSLVDSVLGAIVQEVRFCDRCQLESERRVHRCGTRTHHIRGKSWCTNDTVNAIATASGAATAVLLYGFVRNRIETRAAR